MSMQGWLTGLAVGLAAMSAATGATFSASLDGKWRLLAIEGTDLGDGEPYLEFKAGRLAGNTGCNDLSGQYQTAGDSIRFDGLGVTKMFCVDTALTESTLLSDLKDRVKTYRLTADRLELLDQNGQTLLRLAP